MSFITIDAQCLHCGFEHEDLLWRKSDDLAVDYTCPECGEKGAERMWTSGPAFWFIHGNFSTERHIKRAMREESRLAGYAKSGYSGAKEELLDRKKHKKKKLGE
jgi:hypothetical protein